MIELKTIKFTDTMINENTTSAVLQGSVYDIINDIQTVINATDDDSFLNWVKDNPENIFLVKSLLDAISDEEELKPVRILSRLIIETHLFLHARESENIHMALGYLLKSEVETMDLNKGKN